jgi:subtilisin family serine protease
MKRKPSQPEKPAGARKSVLSLTTRGPGSGQRPTGDSERVRFRPDILDKSVIAIPLLKILESPQAKPEILHPVVIDLNLQHRRGLQGARDWVIEEARKIVAQEGIHKEPQQGINVEKSASSRQYLFGKLEANVIRELVRRDNPGKTEQAIYRIWPDFPVRALINRSICTVKADAAHASFSALGEDIVWAVLDSGIDKSHPHFHRHKNLDVAPPLLHADFTGVRPLIPGAATADAFGHGTHVAGIIAGESRRNDSPPKRGQEIRAFTRYRKDDGTPGFNSLKLEAISGMAPKCKLLSFKVLDDNGEGDVSSVLAAIGKIQEINDHGRRLLIHGVNMSTGCPFEPEWFACGQSPLCVEVDRLVRSGVVVVVAAGNSGYGLAQSETAEFISAGLDMTIDDPGNAESAITVGSTHRDSPHIYGVSYFSSKGPTGDGRIKPDLVAPGEKIVSCATGKLRESQKDCNYIEHSGTSMAAPHVSGVIAAFLSVRREFIGQPEKIKEIFVTTATDLKRDRCFQGAGLVDLMRALQSV